MAARDWRTARHVAIPFRSGRALFFVRMARGSLLSSGSSKRGVAVVGGCLLLSVFAVCVLVCSCFGGSIMGTLFTMSVAALLVVGVQFWYIIIV